MSYYSKNKLLFTTSSSEHMRRTLTSKVRKFAELPNGFSYGDGVPVTQEAIDFAEELILLASDLKLEADAFPNLDGGCAVAFYNGDAKVEVSIGPDGGNVALSAEHGIGFEFEGIFSITENVGWNEIIDQVSMLRMLEPKIWKLFASSTFANSTDVAGASATYCTEIPRRRPAPLILLTEKGGSQSLNSLAPALVPA